MPRNTIDRRSVLAGSAAVVAAGSAAALLGGVTPASADTVSSDGVSLCVVPDPVAIGGGDARYAEVTVGNNQRYVARPDSVRLVNSTEQVMAVVREAVAGGKRLTVRGGGHCFADFVYNGDTKIVLDLSLMDRVAYDPLRAAYMVEGGALLGEVYDTLFRAYGVALPGGVCLTVGIGGHATGGGYGMLSRKFGTVADHIEAVEVVLVDASGAVRRVIASRAATDPNRALWWAVAGGGGGNFGVITRYWFRSRTATGREPAAALPTPPRRVLLSNVGVAWSALTETTFSNLVRNFGMWYARNSAAGTAYADLCGMLVITHSSAGGFGLTTQVNADLPNAAQLLADYLGYVTAGTPITGPFPAQTLGWHASTKVIGNSEPTMMTNPTLRSAIKSAYLKQAFTDPQLSTLYRQFTRSDYANPNAVLQLAGFPGGQSGAPAPSDTANAHRGTSILALWQSLWADPAEDARHLGFIRDCYGQTFAATGGFPVPNAPTDGCYINAPDPDIKDPAFNRSGVSWQTLYYKENYARLQQVKAAYDPTNFFRHSQSITAA
jgi:hypothetical protein